MHRLCNKIAGRISRRLHNDLSESEHLRVNIQAITLARVHYPPVVHKGFCSQGLCTPISGVELEAHCLMRLCDMLCRQQPRKHIQSCLAPATCAGSAGSKTACCIFFCTSWGNIMMAPARSDSQLSASCHFGRPCFPSVIPWSANLPEYAKQQHVCQFISLPGSPIETAISCWISLYIHLQLLQAHTCANLLEVIICKHHSRVRPQPPMPVNHNANLASKLLDLPSKQLAICNLPDCMHDGWSAVISFYRQLSSLLMSTCQLATTRMPTSVSTNSVGL